MPDTALQLHPLRPLGRSLRLALLCAALTACAGPEPFVAPSPEAARKASVAGVPLILQADYHCGPAALSMVMQWAGNDVTQGEIAAQSFTPGARGTYLSDMLGASRRQGQLAVTLNSFAGLLAEVEAGHPVIVFQNLGLPIAPAWHYGVVTAYDIDRGIVTLHSGERDVMRMRLERFLRSWDAGDRWALVVLSPNHLPAAAREVDVLQSAAALERAGQPAAAAAAYRAGAARWPTNWLWPFGLGNALYAEGDLRGARSAFGEALRRDPTSTAARNNLAEVGAELAP